MEKSGIIFIEDGNLNCIHLYKEGSFWKAYENSAYLFVHEIKPYRTKLRYYKNIDRKIVSIGFPDSALAGLIKDRKIVCQTDTSLSIELDQTIDTADYSEWKSQLSAANEAVAKKEVLNNPVHWMLTIRSFPIAEKTPIECLNFISELQKSIADY